ncbi:MAG TPA: tetratricopeptide repeat protein [Pyrinomonadaceae bacterium]|nr:tetratricopeptide repeat protein [Pyrinomonadaceae bacterium]
MPDEPQLTEPLELFYSYSHRDEDLRDKLETHLSMLKRQKVINQWHDRGILAGEEWGGEIDEHLKAADIILLLVSADFLASDYCYDIELKLAMERHEKSEARVVPIILRPCDWSGAPFGKLQALPKNAKPVTTWPNQDEAFTDIAKGIRKVAQELLARRKQNGPVAGAVAAAAPTKSVASQLPRSPVVGFVARRDEQGRDIVGRLKEELAPENNRLVALWGPGGSGKTTLAAEFTRGAAQAFRHRIAWVGALGRADFSLATMLDEIATRLGREDLRRLAPDAKAVQVSALVSSEPTLVVLDNFETIGEEEQSRCLDFLAQSAACPALITTRSRVNRDDVYNVPLASMSMDEARDFLQRLVERTRKPSNFGRLDRDDIIRRCEANPLVLQWVVRQIDLAKQPQAVLDDLARGEGDAAERVFTRSFNLPQLGDDGRAALLALSLFTPDASRDPLAEVAGFDNDLRRLNNAVERLSALWLVETTEGNERLYLRGLTRELAKSRLSKDERGDEFKRRYVAYFLGHAKAHARPTPEDLDALEADKDNLLAAADTALELRDRWSVMLISGAVNNFLFLRGYWDEALRSSEQAERVAREAQVEGNVAYFMGSTALVRSYRGEYEEAERAYRGAIEIFRSLGNVVNVAVCLLRLGNIAQERGALDEAKQLYGDSLELNRMLGNRMEIATCLNNLATLANNQGDIQEARKLYAESLEMSESLGSYEGMASTLNNLAGLAMKQGEHGEARRLYEESLQMGVRLGNQQGIAYTLRNLGVLAEKEGDKAEAARLYRDALRILVALGSPRAEEVRRDLLGVQNSLG